VENVSFVYGEENAPQDTTQKALSIRNFSEEFIKETTQSFGITKIGDYIHVQRQVFNTLLNEGFFTNEEKRSRTDINEESGMVVETNKSGIDETFSFNNFVKLGMFRKISKLYTIRNLPNAIKYGHVVMDNVDNIHNNGENKKFAYIEYPTTIDGKDVVIKLAVKKSPQKTKFWVHNVYTIEKVSDSPASANKSTEAGHITADNVDIISQTAENVKTSPENSKKFSIRDIDNDRYILREAFSDKDFISRYYNKRQELQKYKDAQNSYDKALEKINEIQEQGGEILQGKRRQIRRTAKALEGGV